MRRFLVLLVASLLALTSTIGPAAAVTDGVPDGGTHPYVGLAVFDVDGVPSHRCSGTLLSPKIFLTAGHCTAGTDAARVYFDEHVTSESGYPFTGGYTGTPHTHPNFVWTLPNTSDVGVIVLKQPANGLGTAQLPALGTLDGLATQRGQQEVWFDVVGYGLQAVKPTQLAETSRLQATVRLVNLGSALTDGYNIHHTAAPGTGGGTCFGDSGGPVFLSGSNVVVGINSFVLNQNCAGSGGAYRVDIDNTLSWLYNTFRF